MWHCGCNIQSLIEERRRYAQIWVDQYAPAEFQLTFRPDQTPTLELTTEEKQYLQAVEKLINRQSWQPEALQQALFDLAKSSLGAKQGFQAIYKAFLGKTAGPRAAWFLLNIPVKERQARVKELTGK